MRNAVEQTNTVFRAFADETRLRILNVLLEGELCVCDLCDVLRVQQPKMSRHLAYLRRARLVDVRREGKWKYYSIPGRPTGVEKTLLDCVGSCLRGVGTLRRDLTRLRAARIGGRCET
jgi:ArsR family transcriptional regulator